MDATVFLILLRKPNRGFLIVAEICFVTLRLFGSCLLALLALGAWFLALALLLPLKRWCAPRSVNSKLYPSSLSERVFRQKR